MPSGLAAIANVNCALLASGDEVLLPDNVYGPSRHLAEGELARWGIAHHRYDPMDPADLERRLGPKTRLVWLEAPGSVTMEFPPLAQLAHICRQRGITSALDNTWGAGLAFNGFDLGIGERFKPGSGADIVVHALTKYPSGGGDVLMGSIATRDEALHVRLKLSHMRMGWGVGANDAELVLRSLPSLELRYRAQDVAARGLARWLQQRPRGRPVAAPGDRGFARARTLARPVRRRRPGRRAVFGGLRRALLAGPGRCLLRCAEAVPAGLLLGRAGQPGRALRHSLDAQGRHVAVPGTLVRLAVGLEDVADLRADLERALGALNGA